MVDHVLRYNPLLQALVILQAELLGPVRRAIVAGGAWPDRNPIGAPDPG